MGRCDTPKEMHFSEQPIDWGYLLDKFANNSLHLSFSSLFTERMKFLVMYGMSSRVQSLPFKV